MNWFLENMSLVFSIASTVLVILGYLYILYWRDRERLLRDLNHLLREGLDFLKEWAGDRADKVTKEDVYKVAGDIYDREVKGTVMENLVSREAFQKALWEVFTRWRDEFDAEVFGLPTK